MHCQRYSHEQILTNILERVREHVVSVMDPYMLTRLAIRSEQARAPVRVLSFGKASARMMVAAQDELGDQIVSGVALVPPEHATMLSKCERVGVFPADHPIPTDRNIVGALRARGLVREPTSDHTLHDLLVLVSGGGSAHLSLPDEGLSLDDVRCMTERLLSSGCSIHEMNTVRKHCDQLKGGRFARIARENPHIDRIIVLAVSDVIGDDVSLIASGPFCPDGSSASDALAVLDSYDQADHSLDGVREVLARKVGDARFDTPKPSDACFHRVSARTIASNADAVVAARDCLQSAGLRVVQEHAGIECRAHVLGNSIGAWLARGGNTHADGSSIDGYECAVWGGETSVDAHEKSGRGGRCQETAMVAASAWAGASDGACVFFATDGIDGSTDAAGACIDRTTAQHIARDPDIARAIEDHDSYTLLDKHGVLIRCGPTGTNVNDIAIAVRRKSREQSAADVRPMRGTNT